MRPKTPAAKYYKRIKEVNTDIKPKKTKDPAPGTYDIEECYRKTQWGSNIYHISKNKNKTYVGKKTSVHTLP